MKKRNKLMICYVSRKLDVCKQLVVAKQHAPPITALLAGSHGNASAATTSSVITDSIYYQRRHYMSQKLFGSQFNCTQTLKLTTRRHSVEGTPPPRRTEIGTVSLPASNRCVHVGEQNRLLPVSKIGLCSESLPNFNQLFSGL